MLVTPAVRVTAQGPLARFSGLCFISPRLETDRLHEAIDLSSVKLTHYKLKQQAGRPLDLREGNGDYKLDAPDALGSGAARDPIRARLAEIIQKLNTLFEGELSDADILGFAAHISDKMMENPVLRRQAASNTKEQFALGDFRKALMLAVAKGMESHRAMGKQVLSNERVRESFAAWCSTSCTRRCEPWPWLIRSLPRRGRRRSGVDRAGRRGNGGSEYHRNPGPRCPA